MKQYRGKSPFNIKQVYSVRDHKGVALAVLNNGEKYHIHAKHTGGKYPDTGKPITDYPFAIKQGEVA